MSGNPHSGQCYVRTYNRVYTNQDWWTPYPARADHIDYQGDILFFQGIDILNISFRSDALRCIDVAGFPPSPPFETSREEVPLTPRPVNPPYDWGFDHDTYSSRLSLVSGAAIGGDLGLREKQVLHDHFQGSTSDLKFIDRFQYRPDALNGVLYQNPTWVKYPTVGLADGLVATGFTDTGFIRFGSASIGPTYVEFGQDAYDTAMLQCEQINNLPNSVYYLTKFPFFLRYANCVNKSFKAYNHRHVDISYEFRMEAQPGWGGTFATYAVHILFDVAWSPLHGSNSMFDGHKLDPSVISVVNQSTVELIDKHHDVSQALARPYEVFFEPLPMLFTEVLQVGETYYGNWQAFSYHSGSWHLPIYEIFHRNVDLHMSDIRPSGFFAAAKALEDNITSLKANNVENLAQLSGILETLPDLSGLASLAAKITEGDPSAILGAVDYIADAILRYRFAQAPTAADLQEVLRTDLKRELTDLVRPKAATIYGRFQYTFQGTENFVGNGTLKLETVAKCRIQLDFSTLLASLFTANSVGLLPTLSRLWAVVPFSFVIDWFTNMGNRLKSVDNQLQWLAMRTDYVLYSYKLTWIPSEDYLAQYNIVSFDPETPFGIVCYRRELSRNTPLLRESRFDFQKPSQGPNPVTVGALIWQLI
jgi:hypothetical protein